MENGPKQAGQNLQKWSVSSALIFRCGQYFLFCVYPTSSIPGLPDLKFRKCLWRFKIEESLKPNLPEMSSEIVNGEGSSETEVSICVCKCMKFGKPGQGRSWGVSALISKVVRVISVGKTNEKVFICSNNYS